MNQNSIANHFNKLSKERLYWREKNYYYHKSIEKFCQFIIPANKRVLELGCGIGNLLASVKPLYGMGIDISDEMIRIAKKRYKGLNFRVDDVQKLNLGEDFDFVIMSDLLGDLPDVQKTFEELNKVTHDKTRIIITYYNYLWEPILVLAEKIGLKMPVPPQNWLSNKDIENLLYLANLEVIKKDYLLLIPLNIPFISKVINKYIAKLPLIRNLCLVNCFIVRKKPNIYSNKEYSVSVIIPARNEKGNIEQAVLRTPKLGKQTELIFIEKGSSDGTYDEIKRVASKYEDKRSIRYFQSKIDSKGDKVRMGFKLAKGDILMILDSDLTSPPEDLSKFYKVIRSGQAEFVMGSRLVYPMEREAMRFLNKLGNKFFGLTFSWLLDQQIKDTLCGTKVLFRDDYEEIARNRSYFGDFDPFGDFDLIFGASKLNLKITEIPLRYRARTYGSTNISRFKHGILLLKMVFFAAKKLKFA